MTTAPELEALDTMDTGLENKATPGLHVPDFNTGIGKPPTAAELLARPPQIGIGRATHGWVPPPRLNRWCSPPPGKPLVTRSTACGRAHTVKRNPSRCHGLQWAPHCLAARMDSGLAFTCW